MGGGGHKRVASTNFLFSTNIFAVVMARAIKEKSSTLAYLKWKPNVKWMISCAKIPLAIKSVH